MQFEKIRIWLEKNLDAERYYHVLGVEQTAIELAQLFNADAEKASLGALLHDMAKGLSNEKLLKIIDDNNISVSEEERKSFKTLHSPVGAFMAKDIFQVTDIDILNSIKYHTIGRIGMSVIEKIVFLADKIEANTRPSDFREKVLNELKIKNNLDSGMIICYEATIKSLVERKLYINRQTIDVWNYLIKSFS